MVLGNVRSLSLNSTLAVKMVKYHQFLKVLAKKHCFGIKWGSTTFSGTRANQTQVPYFLFHRGTMTWTAGIKKLGLVLELHGLEYCMRGT